MNKKGFTLVEIIISLVLILSIGTISVVNVTKNNSNKLDEITNKIIEAANVYINIEKDDKGNTFTYGIDNGAKAVQVSVKTLEEKGYISKEMVSTLQKESGKTDELYIMVSNSIKTNNAPECNNANLQSYTVSWASTNETVYLCPYENSAGNYNSNSLASKIKDYYDNNETCNANELIKIDAYNHKYISLCKENYKNGIAYIYRGPHEVNYVKLGKFTNNDGTKSDILWRIIRLEENDNGNIVVLALSSENTFNGVNKLTEVEFGDNDVQQPYYINLYLYSSEYRYTRVASTIKYQDGKFKIYSFGKLLFSFNTEQLSQEIFPSEVEGEGHILYDNPIYKYYYSPISNWYYKTDLENKVIDYEWNSIGDYKVKNKCALLQFDDYSKANYGFTHYDTRPNHLSNEESDNELTVTITEGGALHTNYGYGPYVYKYRYAVAVDETAIVKSGSGTLDDPYIVDVD